MSTDASAAGSPPSAKEVQGRRVAPGSGGGGDFTYTVMLVPAVPTGDRRVDGRIRARLQEGAIAERGRPVGHCRIRDRSRGGARLLLDEARALPARFLLTDETLKGRFWATVVWQNGREAGVRLVPA